MAVLTKSAKRKITLAGTFAATFALCLCMAACAPEVSETAEPADDDVVVMEVGANAEYGSNYEATYLKAAERGCNACHEDLWNEIVDSGNLVHLASSDPGYGKGANWLDCGGCHTGNALGGPMLTDAVHQAHTTDQFDAMGGTCWSCHAMTADRELVMYDSYAVSSEFGGYRNASSAAMTNWIAGRAYESDTIAGITVQSDMPLELVSTSQEDTAKEDRYEASNYGDEWVLDAETWELKVTGVNNPRSFTLDELYSEFELVERSVLEICGANTYASYQFANVPMKGVLLEDVIEACGGLAEGNGSLQITAADGWDWYQLWGAAYNVGIMVEQGAMIVLEEYGEPLSMEAGFPATMAFPGATGNFWIKWMTELNFMPGEGVMADYRGFWQSFGFTMVGQYNEGVGNWLTDNTPEVNALQAVNTMWMNPVNMGDTVTMDENGKVQLELAAYTWGINGSKLDSVAVSADYGLTWTEVALPDTLDSTLATWVTLEWTPEGPGTYVLYLSAVGNIDGWQRLASPITVVVE